MSSQGSPESKGDSGSAQVRKISWESGILESVAREIRSVLVKLSKHGNI